MVAPPPVRLLLFALALALALGGCFTYSAYQDSQRESVRPLTRNVLRFGGNLALGMVAGALVVATDDDTADDSTAVNVTRVVIGGPAGLTLIDLAVAGVIYVVDSLDDQD